MSKALDKILKALPEERRRKIERRAAELIRDHKAKTVR